MNTPLVSIIIPVYNSEPWLAQTIESACHQTWEHLEILIIDDGSEDQSVAIAQSYASEQVKVIFQTNQGASAARNHGLSFAQGDYIQYLDADDLLAPDKVRQQVQLLESSPPDKLAVCSTVHFLDGMPPEQGDCYDGMPFYDDSDNPLAWLVRLLGGDGTRGMVQPAAWLVPRSVADRAGSWNEDLSLDDDGEYFARVILNSSGIRRAPHALTYYRKYHNGSSLSRTNSVKGMWSGLKALNLKAEYLLQRTQIESVKQAIAALYMDWAITAYPICSEVTDLALDKVDQLGVKVEVPIFGGARMAMLQSLLGWRAARLLSWNFHQMQERLAASRMIQFGGAKS